jgi:DNA processing protein
VHDPAFESRERIEAARGGRAFEALAPGLWCAGSLTGLGRPCIAIVGTRAATQYGRRLAHRFAAELAAGGCCVVSGLALGVDAAAHEGALSAGTPTIGVIGSGHRRFFPSRNRDLAERILAGGGAVLSPYHPDQHAAPGQFLQRNGIVAALADAVLVVEAPARSGALNTAGWAAGRVPVLAVPGDVDRRHSAGCLALIRDGATLARNPADVFEALGLAPGAGAPPPAQARDELSLALLRALDAGATEFDEIVAHSGVAAPAVLAGLAMLEFDGTVESLGGSRYARVAPALCGEQHAR